VNYSCVGFLLRPSTIVITQLVFVGHHKERLLESIRALRELPVTKIILFVGEEELPGERRARETAEEMSLRISSN